MLPKTLYSYLPKVLYCYLPITLDSTIIKVQEKAPKIYRKELVELLFEQPYSKIDFVVDKLNVERKAASRYLKELESIEIVESEKVGRETLYINRDLIEILKQ